MPPTAVAVATIFCFSFHVLSAATSPSCGFGQFLQNGICHECPRGTYQDEEGSSHCKPCPPGTFNPYRGAQGLDVCVECPQGTFQNRSSAISRRDCIACPSGTNSTQGAASCIFCPAGTIISNCYSEPYFSVARPERGSCIVTYPQAEEYGYYSVQPARTQCLNCSEGQFSGPNAFSCTSCPSGTFSGVASPSCSERQCPEGSRLLYSGECYKCSNFQVMTQEGHCEKCPPGLIGNSRRGATRCVPCPAGTFKPLGSSTCRPCSPGENSFVTGAHFCVTDNTPCPPNYFRNNNGACMTCTRTQRFDRTLQKCVDCPRNRASEGGTSERCFRCPRNMINNRKSPHFKLACLCKPGFGFVPGSSGRRCAKCPAGTEGSGEYYCSKCEPGSVAPRRGMRRCIRCPVGSWQPEEGQRRCIQDPPNPQDHPCRRGLRRSNYGCVVPHTNCPPNTTRVQHDERGAHSCVTPGPSPTSMPIPEMCPNGTALIRLRRYPETDSYRCGVCEVGTVFNPRTSHCDNCFNHFEYGAGGLSEQCQQCPSVSTTLGAFGQCLCGDSNHFLNGSCSRCDVGTFGLSIDGCWPCPAGTFGTRLWTCRNCPAGWFTNEPGKSSCRRCPEGTTSFGVGDTGCVAVGSLAE